MPRLTIGGLAALCLVLPLGIAPAFGAGGGSPPTCKAGQVYDSQKEKCVPKTSANETDRLYEDGRALAYAGRYQEAIEVLATLEDRGDPRVLNLLGYSNRKLGRLLVGLGYYEEALRIDPDHVLTREYLGEAYLQMGDIAAAREQLGEIARRAGTGSAEHAELARRIAEYETANG